MSLEISHNELLLAHKLINYILEGVGLIGH
jgi:hypothetical protein